MGVALATWAGATLGLAGFPLLPALLLPLALVLPIGPWRRPRGAPTPLLPLALSLAAGALLGSAQARSWAGDCRHLLADGHRLILTGRVLADPSAGPAPFRVERGLPPGCAHPMELRLVLPRGIPSPPIGAGVRIEGRWSRAQPAPPPGRRDPRPDRSGWSLPLPSDPIRPWRSPALPSDPIRSGTLRAEAVHPDPEPDAPLPTAPLLVLRGRMHAAIGRLFPERAPLVHTLVLARRETLAPELSRAFADSGTAHLLAISGFHVGILAAVAYTLLLGVGVPRVGASLLGLALAWLYIGMIGAPSAAVRAAAFLSVFLAARLRGVPLHPPGALASASLLLLLLDPAAPTSVGAILSLAATAGLLLLAPPVERGLGYPRLRGRPLLPGFLRSGLAAGIAATLATLPIVAWSFGTVAPGGVLVSLVATPLVAVALPGVLASLALEPLLPGAARFLAGGTDSVLLLLEEGILRAAALPGVSFPLSRTTLVAGAAGGTAVLFLLRRVPGPRLRQPARLLLASAGTAAALLLHPLAVDRIGRGVLQLHFLDVGQGDATAIRTPEGRWIVVDAGPRTDRFDAGERILVPYLRERGARTIDLLVLTHPHLDHIGGARALLDAFPVGAILDPGHPSAERFYRALLGEAVGRSIPWHRIGRGDSLVLGGVTLRILHPLPGADTLFRRHGANAVSLVVELRAGSFRALLTGDAPAEVEDAMIRARLLPDMDLLKVGHHGSRTSTGDPLLEAIRPEIAVIPAGWRNSFGHPHPEVLDRLRREGIDVVRTDRHGHIRVDVPPEGPLRLRTARPGVPEAGPIDDSSRSGPPAFRSIPPRLPR